MPAIVDLAKDDEQRQILSLFAGGSPLGTALLAPPGVPEAIATALRRGFDATMRDPALLAEVKKAQADVEPLSGEELQKVVAGTFAVLAGRAGACSGAEPTDFGCVEAVMTALRGGERRDALSLVERPMSVVAAGNQIPSAATPVSRSVIGVSAPSPCPGHGRISPAAPSGSFWIKRSAAQSLRKAVLCLEAHVTQV